MNLLRSIYCPALMLAIAALPMAAHATVLYDEIIVHDAHGGVVASVTATPAQLADPNSVIYLVGVAVDHTQFDNYGIVVDAGVPIELFGVSNRAPDGFDLAFALQNTANSEPAQNLVDDTGLPIDLTQYLDLGLQDSGDTASLIVSAPTGAVPEPLTWAMTVIGFTAIGAGLRRKAGIDRVLPAVG